MGDPINKDLEIIERDDVGRLTIHSLDPCSYQNEKGEWVPISGAGKKYKKYIVFHFEQFYPIGGLEDIVGSFDTLEEAEAVSQKDYIVDRDTWEKVRDYVPGWQ